MKLYEIANQYQGLMSLADELPEDALADTLEAITDELEVKAENIIKVIANMDTAPLDAEIKRLQSMKSVITNRANNLKSYLRRNMEVCEIDKIEWPTGSITLRKPTQAVQVDNTDALPEKYRRITVSPDKAAIKADLRAGIEIPGCRMVDGQRGLLIK